MNRNMLRELFDLKMYISHSIAEHMPASTKASYERLEYDLMKQLNELTSSYLGKTVSPEQGKQEVQKIVIE